MTNDRVVEGSYICGAVRYKAEGNLVPIIACHCTECRKSAGNYFTVP